jgi:Fic-DOC domain mobile mystery protein B
LSDPSAADDGETPMTVEERNGLVQTTITLRRELNAAEQSNIATAHARLFGRRKPLAAERVIEEAFVKRVHRDMFRDVWRWAGEYRRSDKNIGVDWHQVPMAIREMLGDAAAWLEHRAYAPDELAVRFHHRLVAIHPFPNGNGRHSRIMADLLIVGLGGDRFTWGGASATAPATSELRRSYIDALRAADRHVIDPLIAFARS